MNIILKEINKDNWEECIELKKTKEQEKYSPSNLYFIAMKQFQCHMLCLGIYFEDIMIGFAAYAVDSEDNTMNIVSFMIDKTYQGKGYGKIAMQRLLDKIKERYDNKEIWISYDPENTAAEKLYFGFGFKRGLTGLEEEHEVFAKLEKY